MVYTLLCSTGSRGSFVCHGLLEDEPRRMVMDERSVIVLYEKIIIFKKEWHSATKPLDLSQEKHRCLFYS